MSPNRLCRKSVPRGKHGVICNGVIVPLSSSTFWRNRLGPSGCFFGLVDIYSNRFWKLRYRSSVRRETNRIGAVGYSWTRRIRQIEASELSWKWCDTHRIRHRLPYKLWKRRREGMYPSLPSSSMMQLTMLPMNHLNTWIPVNNVQWHPEVSHFCEGTPLVLVGTKTDLRGDDHTRRMLSAQGLKPISTEQGAEYAKTIGAKYTECSAKTGDGLKEVFQLALRESMKGRWGKIKRNQKKCAIMWRHIFCFLFSGKRNAAFLSPNSYVLEFLGGLPPSDLLDFYPFWTIPCSCIFS